MHDLSRVSRDMSELSWRHTAVIKRLLIRHTTFYLASGWHNRTRLMLMTVTIVSLCPVNLPCSTGMHAGAMCMDT